MQQQVQHSHQSLIPPVNVFNSCGSLTMLAPCLHTKPLMQPSGCTKRVASVDSICFADFAGVSYLAAHRRHMNSRTRFFLRYPRRPTGGRPSPHVGVGFARTGTGSADGLCVPLRGLDDFSGGVPQDCRREVGGGVVQNSVCRD